MGCKIWKGNRPWLTGRLQFLETATPEFDRRRWNRNKGTAAFVGTDLWFNESKLDKPANAWDFPLTRIRINSIGINRRKRLIKTETFSYYDLKITNTIPPSRVSCSPWSLCACRLGLIWLTSFVRHQSWPSIVPLVLSISHALWNTLWCRS